MPTDPNAPIEVTLAGPPGHQPLLTHFATVCTALRATLRHVERCITGDDAETDYEVVDLKKSSASIKVFPERAMNGRYSEIHQLFDDSLSAIQNGRGLDPRLDYKAIRSFQSFTAPLNKEGNSLSIDGLQLTSRFTAELKKLLEPEISSRGSVTGLLEAVTTHENNIFTLYPPIRNEEVACRFDKNQLEFVLAAHGKNVTVYGLLHFAKGQSCPVRADVDTFDVHPDEADLPGMMDLFGITSGNGVESVQAVRELRDEWE